MFPKNSYDSPVNFRRQVGDTSLVPSEEPEILDAIVNSWVTRATWRLTFVRPWFVFHCLHFMSFEFVLVLHTRSTKYLSTCASSGTAPWKSV